MENMKRYFEHGEQPLKLPLLRPLFEDMCECEELLFTKDTQFARRVYVRSGFAYIEGFLYWLKESIQQWLIADASDTLNFENTRYHLLLDNSFKPDRKGRIRPEPNRMPFINYCAFILRSAAEFAGHDPETIFSDDGWNNMKKSLKVRHRLTHPKKPEEAIVVDFELEVLQKAMIWLVDCTSDIVNSAVVKHGLEPLVPPESE